MEHPEPGTRDLCPPHALHGAHRELVVYITHLVLPPQGPELSLPGSGGQGSPGWDGFAWNSRAQCPVPCLGLIVGVHYTVSVPRTSAVSA